MAKLIASRSAQYPLVATFRFTAADTMVDVNGVEKSIAQGGVFDIANLPPNAVVVSGSVVVDTAVNDGTAVTAAIGDATDDDRYLAATSIASTGRTALSPTGYENAPAENLRLTVAATGGDADAGEVRVYVEYVMKDRANEAQTY